MTIDHAAEVSANRIINNPDTYSIRAKHFRAGLKEYTAEQAESLEWLWGYLHQAAAGSEAKLCGELALEPSELRALFMGKLAEGRLEPVFQGVEILRRKVSRSKPIVKTITTERIMQTLNFARDNGCMTYISGPTGRGKTYTAEYWATLNNSGRTKFVRVPSGCPRRALAVAMGKVCGIGTAGTISEMETAIRQEISSRNVIIVDEAGHLLSGKSRPIEFFRDLHDITGCAVVFPTSICARCGRAAAPTFTSSSGGASRCRSS